jgi:hypothetical protein
MEDLSCFQIVDTYDYENADAFHDMMHETSHAITDDIDDDDEDESLGQWIVMNESDIGCDIQINAINDICLDMAKKEVPIVLNRILKHVYPTTQDGDRLSFAKKVQPIELFQTWAGTGSTFTNVCNPLLVSMQRWIEAYTNTKIEMAEVLLFVEVELMMCFYHCSPSMYYHSEFSDRYTAKDGISEARYRLFLQALSSTKQFKIFHPLYEWRAPFQSDAYTAEVADQFRKHCAGLAFVNGVSAVGLDDDHLRKRSKEVAKCGYTQMNNPKKGQGVVHHAIVVLTTGLFAGGQVPHGGESIFESVSILQMMLAGVHVVRMIILTGVLFFGTVDTVEPMEMSTKARYKVVQIW